MTENAALASPRMSALPLGEGKQVYYGLSGSAWAKIGTIAVLMCGLFWPNLRRLFLKVNPISGESNWQHSMFVPLIGLWYLYMHREELLRPAPGKEASAAAKGWGLWLELQAVAWGIVFFIKQYYSAPFNRAAVRMGVAGALAVFAAGTLGLILWSTAGGGYGVRKDGGRARLRAVVIQLAQSSATWFGTYLLLWGLVFYAWSIWPGQNDFFKDLSMVVTLFAVVLMLCGWGTMRIAWFPILFLVCAIPWPGLVYSWLALPLQKLAAWVATHILSATGIDAHQDGSKLVIVEFKKIAGIVQMKKNELNVAEACAGLKSLMTFVSVAAAVAFLSGTRALWQKLIITSSAVPIAIFCNVMRVTGQAWLDMVSSKWSEGFAHQFAGMIMMIPAFFLILLVGWVLDNIFIEEVDKRKILTRAAARPQPAVIAAPTASAKLAASAALRPVAAGAAPARRPAAAPAPKPAPAHDPARAAQPPANELAAVTQRLTAARAPKKVVPHAAPAPARPQQPRIAPKEGRP